MPSFVLIVAAVCLAVLACSAIELEEIRPRSIHGIGSRHVGKRDLSVIELKSTETFLWGAEDGSDATFGNLTVEMPGDGEGILSMERFDGMLTKVDCRDDGLSLTFEDDGTFEYAKKLWDWVNGAENHQFLMVAGRGDCGDNQHRVPYMISKLTYDEEKNTAKLTGKTGEWKDLLHSYELRVGSVPLTDDLGLRRRDYSKETSFDLASDFRSKLKVKTGLIFGELACSPCFTTGQLKVEIFIKTKWKVPVGLEIKAKPQGVTAKAGLKFDIGSDFGSKASIGDTISLLKLPLGGVTIPGNIMTMGPVLDFSAGVEVTGFEGRVSIQFGATATMPDTANLEANLFNPSENKVSSWVPNIEADPFHLQVKVAAFAKLFFVPSVQIEISALGQGIETGFDLRFPVFEIRGEFIASTGGGACKKGDPYDLALQLRAGYGFEFKFTAGTIGPKKQAVDVTLGTASYPLGKPLCKGWDVSKDGPPPMSPVLPAPTTPAGGGGGGGPGAKQCTAKGLPGTCISKDACSSSGGTSTANQCPKDPEGIQCCTIEPTTPSTYTPNTCTVDGTAGKCVAKTACSPSANNWTKGQCPNDPNAVRCCTPKLKPPPLPSAEAGTGEACTASGINGTCLSTDSCSSSGGKSTPGLCPGPTKIQCCTYKTCTAGGASGKCQSTDSCLGTWILNMCPGPKNIQCCV